MRAEAAAPAIPEAGSNLASASGGAGKHKLYALRLAASTPEEMCADKHVCVAQSQREAESLTLQPVIIGTATTLQCMLASRALASAYCRIKPTLVTDTKHCPETFLLLLPLKT
jgi:hypothetical protein